MKSRFSINFLYTLTAKVPVEPECRVDENCPSQHACINERCQNPCRVNNPCIAGQECVVQDTLPTRTIACICPDGFLVGDGGECNKGTKLRVSDQKFGEMIYFGFYIAIIIFTS